MSCSKIYKIIPDNQNQVPEPGLGSL